MTQILAMPNNGVQMEHAKITAWFAYSRLILLSSFFRPGRISFRTLLLSF
jgi:hypothetical protein